MRTSAQLRCTAMMWTTSQPANVLTKKFKSHNQLGMQRRGRGEKFLPEAKAYRSLAWWTDAVVHGMPFCNRVASGWPDHATLYNII